MKSQVTLLSPSRELFGTTVRQETKTGFLCLTDGQTAYNSMSAVYNWPAKAAQEILSYTDNRERIFFILEKQGVVKSSLNEFMKTVDKNGITKTLKELGVYVTRGRGENKRTFCNPYIWTLIAMEMNPMLYGEVVTWLTDRLILNRIEAGNMYKELSQAVSKLRGVDYSRLSRALNIIVFGRHETGIRNTGTEKQLGELYRLEQNLTYSIEAGFIRSFEELLDHLRSVWHRKQQEAISA